MLETPKTGEVVLRIGKSVLREVIQTKEKEARKLKDQKYIRVG